ncbi:MAG: DUF1786 family protein [Archaeoglobaceae archaeon]|nr:DUF1786 family protein [Archaeoglobaceae archaeon]MDW8118146.1 DUF1786 family protein [Archaeoglobaceae archaeon]
MDTLFTLDVGSTTQDFLLFAERNLRNCPKAILPSPTRLIAGKIEKLNEDLFLHGYTMGGGAITRAVIKHIEKGFKVFATHRSALTFADNIEKVREMGVIITDKSDAFRIKTADVDIDFFSRFIYQIGYPFPNFFAIAVQDHGFSPHESNRIFRFKMFRKIIERGKYLERMLFSERELPVEFNRMFDAMKSVKDLCEGEVFVTDTSFAAISGLAIFSELPALLINFGNSHTTAAVVDEDWEIKAIVEHHTSILREKGKEYTKWFFEKFLRGEIDNEFVLSDNGHGCHIREVLNIKSIVSTGPNALIGGYEEIKGDPMIVGNLGMASMISKRGICDLSLLDLSNS